MNRIFVSLLFSLFAIPSIAVCQDGRSATSVDVRSPVVGAKRDARNQHELEQEVLRQREELRRNPGAYPRQRDSYDAYLSNDPWARARRKKKGARLAVEFFTTDNCGACDKMETYLNDVGVPYHRYYLTKGSDAEAKYLAQIGRGDIPVVRINQKLVRGYHPEKVRALIQSEKPR